MMQRKLKPLKESLLWQSTIVHNTNHLLKCFIASFATMYNLCQNNKLVMTALDLRWGKVSGRNGQHEIQWKETIFQNWLLNISSRGQNLKYVELLNCKQQQRRWCCSLDETRVSAVSHEAYCQQAGGWRCHSQRWRQIDSNLSIICEVHVKLIFIAFWANYQTNISRSSYLPTNYQNLSCCLK